MPTPNYV